MDRLSDIDLIGLIRGNDHSAFRELYNRHRGPLLQQACLKTGSVADAEDILQELFIHLWEKRHSLHITGTVPAYLHIALRNRIINYYHSALTRLEHARQHADALPQAADNGQMALALKELSAQVNDALDLMPEKMRVVYLKSREEGLSAPLIASQLSISEQTVRNQISNALKRLKTKIDAYYKGQSLPNSL
ncbi:RNA polymerase sigma-70 factor [Chitinophaga lutea]|uniref:RNA polymerase sigma-70 factor n=1 Tax=Chitinophaga lutea TaxID=2488634 RepID=UPI0013155E65|nr:RNA polymerase sigma-70 factor [Chitinophaga lutea]